MKEPSTLMTLVDRIVVFSFAFGFTALVIEGGLAFAIALGKVQMETSYGLLNVLGSLNTALGTFVGFAFGATLITFVLRSGGVAVDAPAVDAKKE